MNPILVTTPTDYIMQGIVLFTPQTAGNVTRRGQAIID